ncbi:MAG: glycosyltransferase family 9 protein [Gammaproteobacteria bacterium]|nr:MAG: glycosyltransferase family 9 protein [Gammaproteobacteria bacterium]
MRILCIQLKQLGDVLMTTPAVRALSQHFEGCEIDFVTQRPANAIYEHNPYLRRVYCVRWQARELLPLLIEFRRQKYDVLIDFSGSSKTALFGWATRIPKRIGFDRQKNSWCFTDTVEVPANRHYTADKKSALLTALDLETTDPALDFFLPDDAGSQFQTRLASWGATQQPLFAVSPVSKRAYKVWPVERYAAICDRLVEQYGAQIFFLIGPGERHFADGVKQRMLQPCLPIDENLSLYDAACLLDLADAYIGNDNGLMHLAVARKRPTFSIFGKHSPRSWAAPTALHHAIEYDPGCKRNCYYPGCKLECLTGISVDRVWRELVDFLESCRFGNRIG